MKHLLIAACLACSTLLAATVTAASAAYSATLGGLGALAAFIIETVAFPSRRDFRTDPTPRSIFETRRMGLA